MDANLYVIERELYITLTGEYKDVSGTSVYGSFLGWMISGHYSQMLISIKGYRIGGEKYPIKEKISISGVTHAVLFEAFDDIHSLLEDFGAIQNREFECDLISSPLYPIRIGCSNKQFYLKRTDSDVNRRIVLGEPIKFLETLLEIIDSILFLGEDCCQTDVRDAII